MKYRILIIALIVSFQLQAQLNEKPKSGTFLLKDATLHTVTSGNIEGDLRIKDGRIVAIGENLVAENGETTVDCSGKHIYPGLIDSGTGMGLYELGSISLTRDNRELGTYSPNLHALTAVNPNSVHVAVTRLNGVTTTLSNPTGGTFPGQSALIHLVGYTPDQMFAGFEAVRMMFPVSPRISTDPDRTKRMKDSYEKSLKELDKYWSSAKDYLERKNAMGAGFQTKDFQPQYEALIPAINGEASILIEVNKAYDIIEAIKWSKENEVKAVLTGVSEGWRVADSIAAAGLPVITGPVLSNPNRSSDRYDAPYRNAAVMKDAGVLVALRTNESENVRNLPFNAGFAATYGMGVEGALEAVTINPAKIFGLDKEIGSLEVGKMANLFVADGDAFETKTQISHVFIQGWLVPNESRQTVLYNEFLDRQPGLKGGK